MQRFVRTPNPDRSILRRAAGVLACLALAGAIAAGCGDDGGGGDPASIQSEAGPLAWLPAKTWLVASVDASTKDIDTAIATLDRLPAWSLAESYLPADDGTGLRRYLLEELANEAAGAGGGKVTARQLEAAFGDRAGVALVDNDFSKYEDNDIPLVGWIDVDDPDAAEEALHDFATRKLRSRSHEGVDYFVDSSGDGAVTIQDDILVFASNGPLLEHIIDVHEGDDSLADSDTARAVIEAGIGDAVAGIAVQTDPLLEAVPGLVKQAADEAEDTKDAATAEAIARDLGPVLESAEVDGLVADWFAGSATIDETGLRLRGAWSNPRELADPKLGSRELAERMPADAPTVSAMVTDGTTLGRVQDAWTEVRDAYDLDLRSFVEECDPNEKVFCTLAMEAAIAVLEDEDLAEAMRDGGDQASAYVQDVRAALAGAAGMARSFEYATTGEPLSWTPPAQLVAAMRAAGLVVIPRGDGDVTLRVRPGSPLAVPIREFQAGFNSTGSAPALDLSPLTSAAGITIEFETVDGIRVAGYPQDAPSKVVPALEGDAETLGELPIYQDVVQAAKPPKDVGSYGWLDVRAYVDAILGVVAASQPEIERVIPTVRNNLSDVPGIVWWSTREEIDGEQVGVAELAMPILE